LKVEVPVSATPETPWRITRLARHRYYEPDANRRGRWDEPYYIDALPRARLDEVAHDSDIYTVLHDKMVAVTPLSLDATSRVDLQALERSLKQE